MSFKFFKILFFFSFLFLLQNCGYQPLLTEKNQEFTIDSFNISGDKKLGQMLVNRFMKIENAPNVLICDLKSEKKRSVSNRNRAGNVLEYTLDMVLDFKAISASSGNQVLQKRYSKKTSYKSSTLYSNTLSREKKITNDLVKSIANQIITDLNIIYKLK
tara:strand:+ start:56 stop:532 length:477 start_codon:yes stop_codon:yes gene_type:complete